LINNKKTSTFTAANQYVDTWRYEEAVITTPPNLVHYFHEIEQLPAASWFCTSDPVGARLGSGGGTAWLLDACRMEEHPELSRAEWLGRENGSCYMPEDKAGVYRPMHLPEKS